MKKKVVVFAMLLALVVTMLIPTQAVQAATTLKAPTIKVAVNDDDVPVVEWNKVSGATGYRVYRKTSTDTTWVKVGTTSKTKVIDTKCNAEAGSSVKYVVRAYVKVDGKVTWSAYSKACSVKIPTKTDYTYGISGSSYCTYSNDRLIIADYYAIPSEFVDENTTLKDLEEAGYVFTYYYYYDDNYMFSYSGGSYMWNVYELTSDGVGDQIGIYDEYGFSPNACDGDYYLSYEDSLNNFDKFHEKFLAGELENYY